MVGALFRSAWGMLKTKQILGASGTPPPTVGVFRFCGKYVENVAILSKGQAPLKTNTSGETAPVGAGVPDGPGSYGQRKTYGAFAPTPLVGRADLGAPRQWAQPIAVPGAIATEN